MKRSSRIVLLGAILSIAALGAGCNNNDQCGGGGPDVVAGGGETPPEAPEPTMTCAPQLDNRVRGFEGERLATTEETVDATLDAVKASAADQRSQWADRSFEEFLQTVYKECGEGGKYIVSGDVPIADVKQLREFFETQVKRSPPQVPEELVVGGRRVRVSALVIGTQDGVDLAWSTQRKKQLTYCVSSRFNGAHSKVANAMEQSARAWETVADVDFIHLPTEDANCNATNGQVVFDVRPVDVGGDYYARAFFPNEPRADRNVLIDLSALSLTPGQDLTLTGILRHELGHTLGFRHEHTRPEAGACFEDMEFRPLTTYDRFSVMHYPQCNGGGSWKLQLTAMDKSGAACVYGEAPSFEITEGHCIPRVLPPQPSDAPRTLRHEGQAVTLGQTLAYDVVAAKPGSIVTLRMTARGANPGDPDLYLKLGPQAPRVAPPRYTCRPYLSGATETCEVTVQAAPDNIIRYMVHGYAAGSYDLELSYVPFDAT